MTTHTATHRLLLLTLSAALLAACETMPSEDEEALASATEQITQLDVCAMGTAANAQGSLSTVYSSDEYLRYRVWINDICADWGKQRTTTIVDFWVHGVLQYKYKFEVLPYFEHPITTPAQCAASKMATRIQKRQNGSWVDVKYQEGQGTWVFNLYEANFGHCNTPYFYYTRLNQLDYYNTETNMYRVRTWAKLADGQFATVHVRGTNINN